MKKSIGFLMLPLFLATIIVSHAKLAVAADPLPQPTPAPAPSNSLNADIYIEKSWRCIPLDITLIDNKSLAVPNQTIDARLDPADKVVLTSMVINCKTNDFGQCTMKICVAQRDDSKWTITATDLRAAMEGLTEITVSREADRIPVKVKMFPIVPIGTAL